MVRWCACASCSSRRPRQHSHSRNLIKQTLSASCRGQHVPCPHRLQEMKAAVAASSPSPSLIEPRLIFFFFFSSFFSSCSCNTLFQQLRGVVSEVKAQRVTHLLITQRGNSSTNLVFLGFFVFFIVAVTSKQPKREARGTVCVCDSRCFSCTRGLLGGRRQKHLNRF